MKKAILASVAALAVGMGAVSYANQPAFTANAKTYEQLELFSTVLTLVQNYYVVKVDPEKLMNAALEGMLHSLDPHSSYLTDDDYQDLKDTTKGSYGGLGIEITGEDGAVKVITPMDDSPAAKAGIQSGDYITAIDGTSIIGMRLNDAIAKMKGEAGTPITVTIYRPGKSETFDLELKRDMITVKSVKSRREGDYGYVRINRFSETTANDAKAAVISLIEEGKKSGKPIKGIVLDLRNNPGGLVEQSVCVADIFLSGGEIVSQREREGGRIIRYHAESASCGAKGDLTGGLPVVVLINTGSASAAEIVSGALKDRQRATMVGQTSYGKGSVQSIIPLGPTRAVKLTVARYYTPSGGSIQKTGITPDLEVAQSEEQAKYIATAASQFTEAAYENALEADEGKVRRAEDATQEIPPADFDTEKGDFQLTRALDVLALNGNVAEAKAHPRGKFLADSDLIEKKSKRFANLDEKGKGAAAESASSSSAASEAKK